MRKINKKKVAAVVGTGAMVLSGGGVALAYWTQTGSGAGSAATGTTTAVTVNETTPTSSLYPGATITLAGNFNNPNSGAVRVGTVTATLGTLPSGCVAGDFTLTNNTATVNAEIPSGSAVGTWSGITLKMNDTGVSQDACKNATIPVSYTVA